MSRLDRQFVSSHLFIFVRFCQVSCSMFNVYGSLSLPGILDWNWQSKLRPATGFDGLICHQKSELCANKEIENPVIKNDVLLMTVMSTFMNALFQWSNQNSLCEFIVCYVRQNLYASTMDNQTVYFQSYLGPFIELHRNCTIMTNNVHSLEFQL